MAATVLIVPGFNGSGPDHWQSVWQVERSDCVRVAQSAWHDPEPATWCAAIEAAVAGTAGPVVLACHSLGCATAAQWAQGSACRDAVAGALFVAPCDVDRIGLPSPLQRFAPMPRAMLPFRSTVVASSNDPYASAARAKCFASDWGSAFVLAGAYGHLNAASGLGSWGFGQVLLDALIAGADADRSAYTRAALLRRGNPGFAGPGC